MHHLGCGGSASNTSAMSCSLAQTQQALGLLELLRAEARSEGVLHHPEKPPHYSLDGRAQYLWPRGYRRSTASGCGSTRR